MEDYCRVGSLEKSNHPTPRNFQDYCRVGSLEIDR